MQYIGLLYIIYHVYKIIYGPSSNIKYNTLLNICKNLLKDRDQSHGIKHTVQVYINSVLIYKKMCEMRKEKFSGKKYNMIMMVSMLHDIYDHKYDTDGKIKIKLSSELLKNGVHKDKIESVFRIIDRVSFSYEKRKREEIGAIDKPYIFRDLNIYEREIRDIVSDGDKLEAIGIIGINRCLEFTKSHVINNEFVEPSHKELTIELVKHCEEKLFKLLDSYYIRTFYGRELAKRKQIIMIDKVISRLMKDGMDHEADRIKSQYRDNII